MAMVLLAWLVFSTCFPCVMLESTAWCGDPQIPMRFPEEETGGARIVGGNQARVGSHPWIVSMDRGGGHHCAGALIRVSELEETDILVTAAHCVYDFKAKKPKPAEKFIRAGVHFLFGLPLHIGQQTVGVKQAIWHDWYPETDRADIAILVLNGSVKFNDFVQPICLPPVNDMVGNKTELIVAGWGVTQEGHNVAHEKLLQVRLPVVTDDRCFKILKNNITMDYVICAGGLSQGGRDTCQGDSGGPAVERLLEDIYVMQGVVASGIGCARPNIPGEYTRVSKYVQWIYDKVREHSEVYKRKPKIGDRGFRAGVLDITRKSIPIPVPVF